MTNDNYIGITTGTVATACSLAAMEAIISSADIDCVNVQTPKKNLNIIIDECCKLSKTSAYAVAHKLDILHKMTAALGCDLDSPFMTMAFMALLVIPSIKISDIGLFDGDNFEFIDVIKG